MAVQRSRGVRGQLFTRDPLRASHGVTSDESVRSVLISCTIKMARTTLPGLSTVGLQLFDSLTERGLRGAEVLQTNNVQTGRTATRSCYHSRTLLCESTEVRDSARPNQLGSSTRMKRFQECGSNADGASPDSLKETLTRCLNNTSSTWRAPWARVLRILDAQGRHTFSVRRELSVPRWTKRSRTTNLWVIAVCVWWKLKVLDLDVRCFR